MMKKILCTSILLASCGSFAAAITAVNATAGMGGGYEIVFKNAGVVPTSFNTTSPASIVLDFPNTTSALANRETAVNQSGIYSVNVIPGDARTRAVINLAAPAAYDVRLVGSDVHVVVNGGGAGLAHAPVATTNNSGGLFNHTAAAPVPATVQVQPYTSPVVPQNVSIQQPIDTTPDLAPMFHKNADKGGVLTFTLPSKDALVSVKTEGSSVVATISGYKVPKAGQKRLDVADYGSPVRYVDILPSGADTKVVLNMGRNAYEYVTFASGSEYNIEIKRPSNDETAQKLRELSGFGSGKQYTGQPLSLNFQDIEVRAVLQIIAEFTNNNIVVSDSVVGNITLRLDNVPWDQALDIIMKTKGLAMRKVDRVIYIAPETELNNMEIAALEALRKKQELEPSNTELIQMKYAKAADIMKIILDSRNNSRTSNNSNSSINNSYEDSILSSKGTVAVDERTNSLMITDTPASIQKVRDLIARLDEPVRQVLIDSRLVITDDTYSRDIGSRFGVSFFGNKGTDSWGGSGTLEGANSLASSGTADLNQRLGVNLAPTGSTSGFGVSIIGTEVLVDLELRALQAEGRSETISSPRVVTQDGYKALIAAGQEIPYSTVSDSGTETEFKDAKLSMEVTPRIAPNDRVSMEIHITKDQPDYSNLTNGEPAILTNEIQTKVEIENGETIVLGGIYEQEQGTAVNKVPLLGDIPVIGGAFRNTKQTFNKSELLVFITPRIIDTKLTNTDKFSNLRQ